MQLPDPETHRALRDSVRAFCEAEVRPVLPAHERDETFPLALARKMGAQGLLGGLVPEALGGAGLDDWAYGVVLEELGRYMSVRQIVTVQSLLYSALLRRGSAALQAHYLPRLCAGELLGAYALTEPEAGSDAASLRTRAERDGDGWRLHGEKTFITLANSADLFLVFARSGDAGTKGHAPISAFLVERTWGVQTRPLKGKHGQRASDTGTVVLDGVPVPDANRIGEEGEGLRIALMALDDSRIEVACAAVGLSRACLELSTRYAGERRQFGRALASFQLVQDHLAQMHVDTEAARLLTAQAIAAKLRGGRFTLEASTAKYFASEAAVRNASRAMQVHGGNGYYEDYEVERLARDARILTVYEGTSEIQKLLIASHLTGIRAFT